MSTITFDANGRWACSFKAADFPQDLDQYDPIPVSGVFFHNTNNSVGECGANQSGIYASCNHEAGEGDRAFRFAIGDGGNRNASPLRIVFPEPYHPEIWIRIYVSWEEGWRWEGLNYQKLIPIFTRNHAMYQVLGVNWSNRIDISFVRTNPNDNVNPYAGEWVKGDGGGWRFMYGPPPSGESNAYSDGSWHCIEMYAKMNSVLGVYDGKAAIWVDGQLIVKEETVLWDQGTETDLEGFYRIALALNQAYAGNENGPLGRGCSYTYFDDIVIYNQTPPNVDAHGNPFIGPLDYTQINPTAALTSAILVQTALYTATGTTTRNDANDAISIVQTKLEAEGSYENAIDTSGNSTWATWESVEYNLNLGGNTLYIRVVDVESNESELTRTILYDAEEPVYPEDFGLSSTGEEPFQYFSPQGVGNISAPITLNMTGGDVTSESQTMYLTAGQNYNNVQITAEGEDEGTTWEFSYDGDLWEETLTYPEGVAPGVHTVFYRVTCLNDGTITTNLTSAKVRLSATAA